MTSDLIIFIAVITGILAALLVVIVCTLRAERKWAEKNKVTYAEVEVTLKQMHTLFKDTFAGNDNMKAALNAVILYVFQLRQDGVISAKAIDCAVDKFGKDVKALS